MKRLLQVLPHVVAVILFITVSCIYFAPVFDGHEVKQSDIDIYMGMSKELRDYNALTGDQTLWTGSMFGGMPTYQIGAQHPGNFLKQVEKIYHLGLPRPVSLLFAAFLGFYILCQCLRINPWIGIVAALAFGLASWNFLYIGAGHMSKVNAVTYMAPTLGGLFLAFRGKFLLGGAVTAFFLGMHLSANHFQMTYYLFYLLLFAGIGEVVRLAMKGEYKTLIRASVVLVVAGLLSVLPSFSNLSTTYAYSQHTTRGPSELTILPDGSEKEVAEDGLDKGYVLDYSLGKGELWSVIIPNVKGGKSGPLYADAELVDAMGIPQSSDANFVVRYWGEQAFSGGSFYYGVIICLLFLLGMVLWKSVTRWFLLALIFLTLLLSLKDAGGLTDFFIESVPLFNKFRDTKMMMTLLQILLPLIGALGLQALIFERSIGEWKKPVLITGGAFSLLLVLFMATPEGFFNFDHENDEAIHTQYVGQFMYQQVMAGNLKISTQEEFTQAVEGKLEDVLYEVKPTRVAVFRQDAQRSLMFGLLAFALIVAFVLGKLNKWVLIAGLGIFATVDLYLVDQRYLNNNKDKQTYSHYVRDVDRLVPVGVTHGDLDILEEEYHAIPRYDQKVDSLLTEYKTHISRKRDQKLEKVQDAANFGALSLSTNYRVLKFNDVQNIDPKSLTTDGTTQYFHKSLSGYHGAKLRRYQEVIDFHLAREMNQFLESAGKVGVSGALNSMQVCNMLNARYLLLPDRENPSDTQMIKNELANGEVWFVEDLKMVADANEEIMRLGEINTRKAALIDERYADMVPERIAPDSTADIFMASYAPNEIVYISSAAKEQFAVFSEIYYPEGWQAYIDGKDAEHIRVNYLLRGMKVPPGDHEIVFRFDPPAFKTGNTIAGIGSSLVTLLLLFSLIWSLRGAMKPQEES